MPGLNAEMRDIDDGRRIIGAHAQNLARGQRLQPFARLKHGQWAQQSQGIQIGVKIVRLHGHVPQIGADVTEVHTHVMAL